MNFYLKLQPLILIQVSFLTYKEKFTAGGWRFLTVETLEPLL